MNKNSVCYLVIFLCLLIQVKAQQNGFSGTWILQSKATLSGQDFVNNAPKEIQIENRNVGEFFVVKINYSKGGGYDTTVEKLKLDSDTTILLANTKRSKKFKVEYWPKSRTIKSLSEYSIVENTNKFDFSLEEIWMLSGDNRTLTVTRKRASENDENGRWSVKAEYAKKNSNEIWGIQFITGLSWNGILRKAKQEGKYIFVDCYATWCGPCKEMDRDVFSTRVVGDFMSEAFISVKLQMDKTKNDKEEVKAFYSTAKRIEQSYSVKVLPTYLFFSPDGKIVHKAVGSWNTKAFLDIATAALNPQKQYFTLLKSYYDGNRKPDNLLALLEMKDGLEDTSMVKKIASDYFSAIKNYKLIPWSNSKFLEKFRSNEKLKYFAKIYIGQLSNEELYTKQNLNIINLFTRSSSDVGFAIFYKNPKKVDSICNAPGLSRSIVGSIISKEEIDSRIWIKKNNKAREAIANPNWDQIKSIISNKYGEGYADALVINAKLSWLDARKDWNEWGRIYIQMQEKYGPVVGVSREWYAAAWELFDRCTDTLILKTALDWCKRSFKENSYELTDQYANLVYSFILYKLGNLDKAIQFINKADDIAKEMFKDAPNSYTPVHEYYLSIIKQMRSGDPLWPKEYQ